MKHFIYCILLEECSKWILMAIISFCSIFFLFFYSATYKVSINDFRISNKYKIVFVLCSILICRQQIFFYFDRFGLVFDSTWSYVCLLHLFIDRIKMREKKIETYIFTIYLSPTMVMKIAGELDFDVCSMFSLELKHILCGLFLYSVDFLFFFFF